MDSEDKTDLTRTSVGRPFVTMIRDGVAVLAAILIAFGLDAWWTDRDERTRTNDLLEVMVGEFVIAAEQLDSIVVRNQAAIDQMAAYVRRTEAGSPQIPDDSLPHLVEFQQEGFQLFDPAFGALATLISTGGLERVPDVELQGDLGGWMGQVSDLDFEVRQLEFAAQRLLLAVAGASAVVDPANPEVSRANPARLRRLANSESYREAYLMLILTLSDYQRDLLRLRDQSIRMSERLVEQNGRAF